MIQINIDMNQLMNQYNLSNTYKCVCVCVNAGLYLSLIEIYRIITVIKMILLPVYI